MRHDIVKKFRYDKGKVYLKPFFDIHLGNTACDFKAFKKDLAATNKRTLLFFGGDLFDAIVTPDKRYRKSTDAVKGDNILNQVLKKMTKTLMPYRDRIIGICSGNHEDTIAKKCGFDMIEELCDRLNVPQAGLSGLFRLILTYKGGGRTRTIIVRYHHGWGGGGRTAGNSLTKYSKDLKHWQADLFLYGHDHQKKADAIDRLGLSGDELISKPKILGVCGTYLKTYTSSLQPTYSETHGFPPVSIGGITVEIDPMVPRWVKMRAYLD